MVFFKKSPKYGLPKSIIIHEKKYENSMIDALFYTKKMPNLGRERMLNLVESEYIYRRLIIL